MERYASLEIFAEIGVALAGFSGVAAAIAGRAPEGLAPRQRIGFWMVLVGGLGVTLWALLPRALANFVDSETVVWRSLCLVLVPYTALSFVIPWRYHKRLEREGHPSRVPRLYPALGACTSVLCLALLLAAFGLLPAFAVYFANLVAAVAFAGMSFLLFLLVSQEPGRSPGADAR